MNSVVLIGRLTRDPEVRYTTGDNRTAVATFSIAIDRPMRAGQEKKTDFPRITVFGRQAENCERFLSKGRQVAVQGRIQTGSYTNRDGQTVYTTDVVANNVEFLGSGNGSGRSGYQGGTQNAGAQQQDHQETANDSSAGVPEGFQAIEDDDIPF